MNNFYHLSLNAAKEKYYKFRNRLEKKISSGQFDSLNRNKKNQLVNRVEKYRLRLESLGFSVKGALATGSIAAVSAASAQTPAFYENASQQVSASDAVKSVAVDIDNDTDLEILLSTSGGGLIREGDIGGFTAAAVSTDGLGSMSSEFVVGDLDGDNIPDILFQNGSSLVIAENDGSGNFYSTALNYVAAATGSIVDFEIVDLDGDGDNDIAWVDSGGSYYDDVRYRLNDGTGNFAASTQLANIAGSYISQIAFTDIDGDGDTDIVIGQHNGNFGPSEYEIVEILNNSAGAGATPSFALDQSFTFIFNESYSTIEDLMLDDIDGDGEVDLLVSRYYNFGPSEGTIHLFGGSHVADNPNFNSAEEINFTYRSAEIVLTDIDGDGVKDVLFTDILQYPELAKIGNGLTMQGPFNLADGYGYGDFNSGDVSLSAGDFDGDGNDDLIVGNGTSTELYLNVFDKTPAAVNAIKAVFNELSAANDRVVARLVGVNSLGFDVSGSLTFSLVAGDGTNDADNSSFEIVNSNQLVVADGVSLDFETKNEFRINVEATDGAAPITEAITLLLDNSPEEGYGTFEQGENLMTSGGNDYRIYKSQLVDVDGDSNLDLIFLDSNYGGDLYFVNDFLNSGFSSVDYLGYARGFAVGDVDGDDELDLVTVTYSQVRTYLGDGSGSFTFDRSYGLDYGGENVKLVDLDGDGVNDIVVQTRYSIEIFSTDGGEGLSAGFNSGYAFSGGNDFAFGDRDGDGILDIAVLADYGDAVYLFDGDEAGNFNYYDYIGTYYSYKVEFADTDNDGDDDLLLVGENYLTIYDNSEGSFTNTGYYYLYNDVDKGEYAIGDFDGDNDIDVLIGYDNGLPQVFLNDGSNDLEKGAFVNLNFSESGSFSMYSLAVADMDGDDDLDILMNYRFNSNYGSSVLTNQNVAPFITGFTGEIIIDENVPVGSYLGMLEFDDPNDGDVATISLADGDNNNDLISLNSDGTVSTAAEIDWEQTGSVLNVEFTLSDGTNTRIESGEIKVRNLVENGKGTFASEGLPLFGFQEPRAFFAEDIDLDGDYDLLKSTNDSGGLPGEIVQDSQYANSLFVQSNSSFNDNPIFGNPSFRITSAAFIDADNDGDLDIVGGENGRSSIYFFENDTYGFFQNYTVANVSNLVGIVNGDFDGDGQDDVAIIGRYEIEILTKNPDGGEGPFDNTFISIGSSGAFAGTIEAVAVGDFDGDGYDDLFLGISYNDDVIFSGSSDGLTSTGYATAATGADYGVSGIATGDFDDDGSLDIAMITADDVDETHLSILLNNGSGSFSLASSIATGGEYEADLKAGDLDGDGSVDLITSQYMYDYDEVEGSSRYNIVNNWMNDGDGGFTIGEISLKADRNSDVELMDVDGDDDYDIVYEDYDSQALYVIKNINVAPTAIELSNTTIDEGLALGTEVATVNVIDPNISDTHVAFIASGDGSNDTDNANFVIDGDKLRVIRNIEFNDGSSLNINIKAIDQDGASVSQSFTLTVNEVLGLDDSSESFIVYPNPGNDRISISLNNEERGKLDLRVVDMAGRSVFEMTDEKTSNIWTMPNLDMSDAETGIYVVEIKVNDTTVKQRWIKE
ncbi:FG-GAP-like repeat-containing protein [Ekhidna sp.]|uniref:FG-GAP-like repeat-containing protein n=1 Tax=Ekhidna sp. TaxID=2608089 RepID=UPI003C7E5A13